MWGSAGIKSISLSVTENSAVSLTSNNSIIVKPTANFNLSSSVCQNDTTSISYVGSAGSLASYSWNFGGGIVTSGSGQGPYNVYWYSSGEKVISLIVINSGIVSDVFTDTIMVYSIPSSIFTVASPITTGDSSMINYIGSSQASAYYNWEFANGIVQSGSGQGPYQIHWDTSGVKAIKLIVVENGCSSPQTQMPIMVNPSSDFTMDTSSCLNEAELISYTGQASSSAVYSWNFDGGQIISGVGQGPYAVNWNSSGLKNVSLTVYENGLSSNQTTHSINVNSLPSVSISQNNEICLFDSVLLVSTYNSGLMPISYLWSSGDTNTTSLVVPVHDSTFYLNVIDANGCMNIDSSLVIVNEPYADEEICLVTVDSLSNKNIIVWQKTTAVATDLFKIYKESTTVNVYDSIGFRPYDSLSVFIDYNSQPTVKSAKYRISVVDSCGNESAMSPYHTTMHLTINKGLGWSFNLIWTPYEGFQVQTYRIWRWKLSSGWSKIDSVSGGATTFTDNPSFGLVYYFVEIVPPGSCALTKANTNYNTSRSNRVSTSAYIGLEDIESNRYNFTIQPNPNKGIFKISINSNKSGITNSRLQIFNSYGELVMEKQFSFNKEHYEDINLQTISKGIYYIRLTDDDGNYKVRKVIVQ